MNFQVWCSLQMEEDLRAVEMMLPNLAWEHYEKINERNRSYRNRRTSRSVSRGGSPGFWKALGGIFIVWGGMMLVPGPVDAYLAYKGGAVGFALGGPVGAAIGAFAAVAAYNIFALAVVAVGTWMLTW